MACCPEYGYLDVSTGCEDYGGFPSFQPEGGTPECPGYQVGEIQVFPPFFPVPSVDSDGSDVMWWEVVLELRLSARVGDDGVVPLVFLEEGVECDQWEDVSGGSAADHEEVFPVGRGLCIHG